MYTDLGLDRHTVGIADMYVSNLPGDEIITHALGSCLGVAVYDPTVNIGGLVHLMLPLSKLYREKAAANPLMFVDTGIPTFFKKLYDLGASKDNVVVKVAGGAHVLDAGSHFKIGERNYTVLRKILWKNDMLIASEEVGGTDSRTMALFIGDGKVLIKSNGTKREL